MNKTRLATADFLRLVQGRNAAAGPRKRPPEGTSCKTCAAFVVVGTGHYVLKNGKPVMRYNVCERWKGE